jgi:competence protein ComEA
VAESADIEGSAAPTPPSPLERLVWEPSWRERLAGLVGGMPPLRLAAAAVASVAVVVLVAVAVLREPAPLPELTMPVAGGPGDPAATTTTATVEPVAVEVVVHAAGAVVVPGLHRLEAGARVADLLDAAGGPAPGADLDRLNLAAPLVDGERIFVPMPEQAVPAAEGGGPGPGRTGAGGAAGGAAPAAPVDLNRATSAELESLPGIGPATAQAILDERARRGRFGSVDELLEVRGIGDAKLAALRDLARV